MYVGYEQASVLGDKMIHGLARRVALVFASYGECNEDEVDIYTYALEAMIAPIVNIVICLIISLVFGRLLEGTIFILAFMLLRRFTGGYHAKTHYKCILTFCTVLALSFLLSFVLQNLNMGLIAAPTIATSAWVGILALTLIKSNKEVSLKKEQHRKQQIQRIVASTLFFILCVVLCSLHMTSIAMIISTSMFFVFIGLLFVYLNRRKLDENMEQNDI